MAHAFSKRIGAVAGQDVQLSLVPRHVLHRVALQFSQTCRPPSGGAAKNWPSAQTVVHVPAAASNSAPSMQEVQLVAPPAEHVAHVASQTSQLFSALSVYLPAGQSETHAPLSEYGVPLLGQLRQANDPGPLHIAHDA